MVSDAEKVLRLTERIDRLDSAVDGFRDLADTYTRMAEMFKADGVDADYYSGKAAAYKVVLKVLEPLVSSMLHSMAA